MELVLEGRRSPNVKSNFGAEYVQRLDISIHWSRVGPDRHRRSGHIRHQLFQFTGPVWDPTRLRCFMFERYVISIHGSRVGPDGRPSRRVRYLGNFNPRVPCGTRLRTVKRYCLRAYFNPRVPCGTRLNTIFRNILDIFNFNPRVPCGTRRRAPLRPRLRSPHFNPRVPCGTRLVCVFFGLPGCGISIHGSRVGPDVVYRYYKCAVKNFNPRVPCGTRPYQRFF